MNAFGSSTSLAIYNNLPIFAFIDILSKFDLVRKPIINNVLRVKN